MNGGYIYLIWAVGTNRYKIGKSEDTYRRLEQLSAQNCYPLKLLQASYFENFDEHEKRVHKVALPWKVHGEWFELPDCMVKNVNLWFSNPDCVHVSISESGEIVETCLQENFCKKTVKPKRGKPYAVKQREDGTFVAALNEAIDSQPIVFRTTSSMYTRLEAVAGKKKAEWIRQAIREKLEFEYMGD